MTETVPIQERYPEPAEIWAPRGWLTRVRASGLAWLLAERERWVLWLPVLVAGGILIYFALPVEPALWPGFAAFGALSVIAAGAWRRPMICHAAIIAAAISLGFGMAALRTTVVAAPILETRIGPVEVTGTVREAGADAEQRRFVLEDLAIDGLDATATPARVRISARGRAARGEQGWIAPGDRIRIRAVLRPPPEPIAPGAWDFGRAAYFERIGGIGYAVGVPELLGRATNAGFWPAVTRVRETVSRRMIENLPGEAGPFAAALLIGDRSALPADLMNAMRDSGLAHLIAISGLNLGLVAGFVFIVLRAGLALIPPLALRFAIKKWAALGALIASFGYLLLSGASVPIERAFLMTALVLIAIMLDRTSLSMRLLMWAALVLILIAPEDVLGPSFQMSFGATVALIAAYESIREPLARFAARTALWQRPALYVAAVAFTSLVAGLATGPFALYHFNRFADYGLVANLVAVPLTGLWVMPWGVVALLLMPFGGEWLALQPMSLGLDAIAATARMVAAWPGAVSLVPAMPPVALLLIALGGLWLCLWRRRARLLAAIPLGVAIIVITLGRPPDLLVDGEAKLFAARTADGALWLSSRRQARFIGEAWLRRAGQAEAGPWPLDAGSGLEAAASEDAPVGIIEDAMCDAEACALMVRGQQVSILRHRGALEEECTRADVVIALIPLRVDCRGPRLTIDRFDLWREGSHALWLDERGAVVETVRAERGRRPWAPPRTSRKERDARAKGSASGDDDMRQ